MFEKPARHCPRPGQGLIRPPVRPKVFVLVTIEKKILAYYYDRWLAQKSR